MKRHRSTQCFRYRLESEQCENQNLGSVVRILNALGGLDQARARLAAAGDELTRSEPARDTQTCPH
jgi:hypothetical protein